MKKLIYLGFCIALLCSCEDKLEGDSYIINKDYQPTELDMWVTNTFTDPLNIEVVYKWRDNESDFKKNLVPPRIETVQPFMDMVRRVWINSYLAVKDSAFMKKMAPKQFLLVGSGSWNQGSVTQGTAEGGRRITMYQLNNFNAKNYSLIKRYIHVIHHEFGHILQQDVSFNVDYKNITPGYLSDWQGYSDSKAREMGFISAYSMSASEEDFTEMIAFILTSKPEEYKAIIESVKNPEAQANLRKKDSMVRSYFQEAWGIDMGDLQKATVENMKVETGQQ